MLGLSDDCTDCPGTGPGTHTTYAAAQQCDVERVDLLCDTLKDQSFAYDKASQECKLCPAGTYRDYNGDTACIDWWVVGTCALLPSLHSLADYLSAMQMQWHA